MEVGPLARMLVGYASGREDFKEVVDSALTKLDVPASLCRLVRVRAHGTSFGSIQEMQSEEEARNLEQTMVNTLLPTGKLLNVAVEDVTKTSLGLKRSVEIREKMSESQTGRKFTNEAKKNMSDAQKRYLSTPEGQARFSNIINKISKTVTIDGNTYSSISEASRILGIPYTSLVRKYNL
jgi:hypothetical protein